MIAQARPDGLQEWLDEPRWWMGKPAYGDPRFRVGDVSLPDIIEVLRQVYDENACRAMIMNGYWAPLAGLFSSASWLESFGMMLALGADLVAAPDALDDVGLVNHLRMGRHWWGARVEVGVRAGLRRVGLHARRPSLPPHVPQWDLSLEVGGLSVSIECKALSTGNVDGNFNLLEERFQNYVFVEVGRHRRCDAQLALSDYTLTLMEDFEAQPFFDKVLPEFTVELQTALRRAELDGQAHPVGRFGHVALSLPASMPEPLLSEWTAVGHERSHLYRLRRLVQSYIDASENLKLAPPTNHRVAVVWTGKDYLRSSASAQMIGDNIGNVLVDEGHYLKIDPRRLGFETGVVLGAHSSIHESGWALERAHFITARTTKVLPEVLLEGIGRWDFHLSVIDSSASP